MKDATVLTIAHRINTIIDYDRILVLDSGNMMEYDTPYNLINRDSIFLKLVEATGDSSSSLIEFVIEHHRQKLSKEEQENEDKVKDITKETENTSRNEDTSLSREENSRRDSGDNSISEL
jgi:ABC-type multidrug transport system ATPase subunit